MSKSFLYRQRFGYGMGDFACNLIWQVISLYLLYFYTDVMKLDAASIATMFVVCRIIDGITDVLVGYAYFCCAPTRHIHAGARAARGSCSEQSPSRCRRSSRSQSRTSHLRANSPTLTQRISSCRSCIQW